MTWFQMLSVKQMPSRLAVYVSIWDKRNCDFLDRCWRGTSFGPLPLTYMVRCNAIWSNVCKEGTTGLMIIVRSPAAMVSQLICKIPFDNICALTWHQMMTKFHDVHMGPLLQKESEFPIKKTLKWVPNSYHKSDFDHIQPFSETICLCPKQN